MTELYIVTGFLGAGKTTFMKKLIRLFSDRRLSVIVNEFGRENIDEQLLAEMHVALSGISGGSIFCSCRMDQFEKALSDALRTAPDAILVETSGLSDPTSMRRVLTDRPEFRSITYRLCIAVADARRLNAAHETARVLKKQLAACDLVLLNKADDATAAQRMIDQNILESYVMPERIFPTNFGEITPEIESAIRSLSANDRVPGIVTADIGLHSIAVKVCDAMTVEALASFLERIAPATFRIKGFLRLSGRVFMVDCVGEEVRIEPAPNADPGDNQLVILYGYGQNGQKAVRAAAAVFPNDILSVEVH